MYYSFICQSFCLYFNTGVASFVPSVSTSTGDSNVPPIVNCSIAAEFGSSQFSLGLFLILTGVILICLDIIFSVLLCCIRFCSCRMGVFVLFLVTVTSLTVWVIFGIVYMTQEKGLPTWLNDKSTCSHLVVISSLVALCIVATFVLIYIITIITAICCYCYRRNGFCSAMCHWWI